MAWEMIPEICGLKGCDPGTRTHPTMGPSIWGLEPPEVVRTEAGASARAGEREIRWRDGSSRRAHQARGSSPSNLHRARRALEEENYCEREIATRGFRLIVPTAS
jgi:hypothetical protein